MSVILNKRVDSDLSASTSAVNASPRSKEKVIISVGGGKGGVGKTLITANLGIMLARDGRKVVLIDLDLGGANLHTCLGVELSKHTLSDFIQKDVDNLSDILIDTPIKNLKLISGAQDILDIANIKYAKKLRFISKLKDIDADYIILDLGAGTSFNTLDFFLASDIGIVTLVPEPTSIENVYRFIKSAFYRKIKNAESSLKIKKVVDDIMKNRVANGISTPSDLLRKIEEIEPEMGVAMRAEMSNFSPKLIINMVRSQTDVEIGHAVTSVCKKYFGIDTDLLGFIEYDNLVWQSIRRKSPVILEFPNSKLISNFNRVYKRIMDPDVKFIDGILER